MIHLKVPAGAAAIAVVLVSIFAPVDTPNAVAQASDPELVAPHTHRSAEEVVPEFVAKEVVQPVPAKVAVDTSDAVSLSQLVARMPREAVLDEQLECLAEAIYFEARGEPLYGQLAVAEVIVNRAASGRFPASYCEVVMQPSQFSFVKRGRMPAAPKGSETYRRAKAIAQIAHRDLWNSQAEGALYFHARHVSPAWSGRRQAAARIHNHVFYR